MISKNRNRRKNPKLLLSLLIIIFCIPTAWAQAVSIDRTNVSFSQREMTISEAFRQIESQTLFRFALTDGKLDTGKRVGLPKTEYTVKEAVERLLAGTGYTYTLRQVHFVIVPRQESPGRQNTATFSAQYPVIIADRDLKKYVAGEQRGADSVIRRIVETEPILYNASDKHFPTPGELFDEGRVPAYSMTAERWQRSKFALKTNLLYGGVALAPNLRAEMGLGSRTTLEAGLSYNGWNLNGTAENNKKLVHGVAIAEYRYWFCERFSGHFLGAHAFGSFYNVSGRNVPLLFDKEYRYEGTAFGFGVSYGYMLPLAPRWGVEFNLGLGVAFMNYDKYGCDKCDELIGNYKKTYFGPTRAGITLVFLVK